MIVSVRSLILLGGALALAGGVLAQPVAGDGAPVAAGQAKAVLSSAALMSAKASRSALLDVSVAGDRLVAVGERGIAVYSDDAGQRWTQAKVPVSVTLTRVQFVSAKEGWAVGHQGVVLHSVDGGASWVKQLDGIAAAQLALKAAQATGEGQAVRAAEQLVQDGADKPWLDLHFFDARNGLVVGAYNLALRTRDGGASWESIAHLLPNPKGLHLYGLAVSGKTVLLAGEQGLLMRSLDEAEHFEALSSPYRGSFFGVQSTGGEAFVAYGLRGTAYWTGDAGKTWERVETGVSASLGAAARLGEQRVALLAQDGTVLVSQDGGRQFTQRLRPVPLPLTGLVQAGDGAWVAVGLRGAMRLPAPR